MKTTERRLLEIYRSLDVPQQETLLRFAQFLAQDLPGAEPDTPQQVIDIPRQAGESVVAAIKRLAASYPMLDKARMLDRASLYMARHVIEGQNLDQVITELEREFRQAYEQYLEQQDKT